MKYIFLLLIGVLELGQYTLGSWESGLRCPPVYLTNGKVQIRRRGKIIRFKCIDGFTLIGDKYSTCVRGNWDTSTPVCVNSQCATLPAPDHALVAPKYNGAILMFFCEPGYILIGSGEIYCNGKQWNVTAPYCRDTTLTAPTKCDFEKPDLCWWEQDPKHDFDWRRHNFETPSSHIGTGPTHDHTLGPGNDGYYLYIEASGRLVNDTARIISPLYNSSLSNSACFSFWYHMYGATIGTLRIYFKPESNPDNSQIMFEKHGNQGNQWLHGLFNLTKTNESFQIIIEGVRGAGYVSDLAVDDVAILQGDECLQAPSDNQRTTVGFVTEQEDQIEIINAVQSCRGRCGDNVTTALWPNILPTSSDACHCSFDCADNSTCCPDFAEYCVLAGTTDNSYISETNTDAVTVQYYNVSTPVEPKDELEPYTTKFTYLIPRTTLHPETPFASFNTSHHTVTTESHFMMERVQQLHSIVPLGVYEIISIIVALIVLGSIVTTVTILTLRWRKSYQRGGKSSKGSGLAEDSDVRYLTSDEILDFNLARPMENDEP